MKDSQKLKKKVKKFIRRKPEALSSSIPATPSTLPEQTLITPLSLPFHQRVRGYFAGISLSKLSSSLSSARKLFFTQPTKFDFMLVLVPLCLLIVLFVLTIVNTHYLEILSVSKLATLDEPTRVHPYPIVATKPLINLSAKAAIVVEADSQVPLFEKNSNLRFPMASTTKIMTALTAMEHYKNDDILTVKSSWVEGSQLGLYVGEQFYFEDLLYAMLLPSANDAAMTLAANYPRGVSAFVQKMNDNAAKLHLKDTHFSDPTGLDDDGDYTTVVDMARLASYAIKNKEFTDITSTKYKAISTLAGRQFDLYNLNQLLGSYGVTGIKTGTTEGAGEVLVTSAVEHGHTFIIVVMNSQQRFIDTQLLLNFVTNNVNFINPEAFAPRP